jgi:hypothetical protein
MDGITDPGHRELEYFLNYCKKQLNVKTISL